jgi:hypothetical protein
MPLCESPYFDDVIGAETYSAEDRAFKRRSTLPWWKNALNQLVGMRSLPDADYVAQSQKNVGRLHAD